MGSATLLHEEQLETKRKKTKKGKDTGQVERPDAQPYTAVVTIEGVAPFLYHKFDPENVERQANSKKGSNEKKTDNLEAYVYRCPNGNLGVPATWFKAAMAEAGRKFSDPSSPRKSARDLVRAAVVVGPFIADLKTGKDWDAVDVRGVVVQRNRVVRRRPMMDTGWQATFEITVNEPQYIDSKFLYDLVSRAGSFCGFGDHRPDFGRFCIVKWDVKPTI